ncbi:MAG TPA: 2-amino-4-hydroxy-6-hydroxymethyldihydropteridine diphosphokinase [Mycobacteriales bacterium]
MSTAVLSIGSNLGDRLGYLQSAVDALGPVLVSVSGVYETAPWGPVEQDDYLNAVLVVSDDTRAAVDWWTAAQELEQAAGRERDVRWGPRTLDVDIVQVLGPGGDAVVSETPELVLPHPRAAERAFVLVPWADAEPDAVLAGHGRVVDLLAALPADERAGVRRREDIALTVARP